MSTNAPAPRRGRASLLGLIAVSVTLVTGSIVLAPAASASNTTLTATGTFVVPTDVVSIDVVATGANGLASTTFVAAAGGHGAIVTATVAVTPGETLSIGIAGEGGGSSQSGNGGSHAALSRGGVALVVAGGGGGGGGGGITGGFATCTCNAGGAGGDAGNTNGSGNAGIDGAGAVAGGGSGATVSAAGARGAGAANGTAGTSLLGGSGGTTALSGGGGGGGYFGGGGGGGGNLGGGGGGGGGGSSYVVGTVTGATVATATVPTAASVSLTYTPASVAAAPTGLVMTPGNGQLSVAFVAGANGGSAITNYQYSTDGGTSWTTPSPVVTTSPLLITGLTNGTTYQVRLRALNGIGTGSTSAATGGTPATLPGAPTGLVVTSAETQLSVAFVAGADGGSAITNYRYSTDGGTTWTARSPVATTSPLLISGLASGTGFTVRIGAVNAIGAGTGSATVASATSSPAVVVPPAPTTTTTTAAPTPTTTPPAPDASREPTLHPISTGTGTGTGASAPLALLVVDGAVTTVALPANPSRTPFTAAAAIDGGSSIGVTGAGRVFTTVGGDFHGELSRRLNQPIVNLGVRTSAQRVSGYWLLGADGGVFNFGSATYHGSAGSMKINQPMVAMAGTTTGNGYWLVAADGGVFTFGDATFHGSTGSSKLRSPIAAILPTATGRGYYLVATDGGVFTFGDARFYGSGARGTRNIVGVVPTGTDKGYWLVAADRSLLAFGDAVK